MDGVYHRSWAWEKVLRGVEGHVIRQRVVETAPQRWFPPIMPREEFLKTDYVRSFPDLVGSIDVFTGGDKDHRALLEVLEEGGDWTAHLTPSEVVLPSSVCHPLYGNLPQEAQDAAIAPSPSGWSFRHEPSLDPARMQMFRIYEFVKVGTPEQALAHRDQWLERGLGALRELGLTVRSEAVGQKMFGLIPDDRRDEIEPFGKHALHLADDTPAHSACIGFGLDRITLALFATHGMDVASWPGEVRSALAL